MDETRKLKDFKTWFLERHGFYPMSENELIGEGLRVLLDEMSVWATEVLQQAASQAIGNKECGDV